MKKACIKISALVAIVVTLNSCASMNKTMREPYSRVDFTKNDFTLSEQVTGQGKCTKVLGIDFYHWFHSADMGAVSSQDAGMKLSASSIPVIGGYLSDHSTSYALYDLMSKNPGYDVIFYPQFETRVRKPIFGIGLLYKKTTVKTMARLGKLK